MGLMNKLRDKTHIILIILIIAFLATIVFEWGMDYLGMGRQQTPELGSVNGQEIKFQQYEEQVQFAIEQQRQQTGQEPDENMINMIREQVWDQMVTQLLVEQEIKRLGITVTNDEILNWVYNSPQTLPDAIKRNFVDSTGQFRLDIYQQALATKTPEVTKFWSQVEQFLRQTLLSQKLQSVITGTVRVTESEVLQKFKDDNIRADFDYIFLDVSSISDDQVKLSDDELKAFYDRNKLDYRRDQSVKLRYVLFPDIPTAEDSLLAEKQLKALTKELRRFNIDDSSTYSVINDHSISKFENKFYKPSELSPEVVNYLFSATKDSISDVIKSADGYHLVRLIDSREGDDVFVNAAHILVSFGSDTNAAKVKADEIMKRLNNGEDFSKLAFELSDDPGSKEKGGNLGWFTKGAMVKEFEEVSFNAPIGKITGPVKTQFGYHIIKVLNRQKKEFKLANIKINVKASGKTKDAARKRAEDFAYISRKGNFEEEAKKSGLQVIDIPMPVTKNSFIPGAGQNSSVTRFAFNEKKGAVSDPIKIQNGYAVYYITDVIPAGIIPFEEIKTTTINAAAKLDKKLDILKNKADEIRKSINGNLETARNLFPDIKIEYADSVSVNKPDPKIGSDPSFTNALFKLTNGQVSDPIRTQRGYYIVQMKSITPFDQNTYQQEFPRISNELIAQKKQIITQEWIGDLKDKANIVDNRDKFYR